MVTVLVLLCFEEKFVCGTSGCSLVPPPPEDVLFIVLLLFVVCVLE